MRKQSFYDFFTIFTLFALLLLFNAFFSGCDENSTRPSSTTTVTGTLNLPFEAIGKTWAVLIDNDMDGGNGYLKMATGLCSSGLEISYSVNDAPQGV